MNEHKTTAKVTLNHIQLGEAESCTKCPVALALTETNDDPYFRIEVNENFTNMGTVHKAPGFPWKTKHQYHHSLGVEQWIKAFDVDAHNTHFNIESEGQPGPVELVINHKSKIITTAEELEEKYRP